MTPFEKNLASARVQKPGSVFHFCDRFSFRGRLVGGASPHRHLWTRHPWLQVSHPAASLDKPPMVTGVPPCPPPVLAFIMTAHRVHSYSALPLFIGFHRASPTQALALSGTRDKKEQKTTLVRTRQQTQATAIHMRVVHSYIYT